MAKEVILPQPVTTMTAAQLARRRRLTDVVIAMVDETGPDNLQMREVAERSGVALGTTYRYFSSKDHLLAAAWGAWHRRLTDRVRVEISREQARAPRAAASGGPHARVLEFVHRELRAFQRHPNFARLVVHVEASPDPFAAEELGKLGQDNRTTMAALMVGVPAEVVGPANIAIGSVLAVSLNLWITGRLTIADAFRDVEDVVRLVLSPYG